MTSNAVCAFRLYSQIVLLYHILTPQGSNFYLQLQSIRGNTRDVPFFNLNIIPLATGAADKCVEDGGDSEQFPGDFYST